MKKYLSALAILAITSLTGCVAPGGGGGLLFSSHGGPFQATSNKTGSKLGEASAHCVLGIACFGSAGIHNAAQDGNVSKIATVDYQYFSILLWLYTRTTVIVTGE